MGKSASQNSSKTGYARTEGSFDHWNWVWEVRSVNGKSLDMRLRLPPGFESLDPKIRKSVSSALGRGNLQISLAVTSSEDAGSFSINENWLRTLVETGQSFTDTGKVGRPRLDGLYLVNGVIVDDLQSASDPALKDRNTAILASLATLTDTLIKARRGEGAALYTMLVSCIEHIAKLTKEARVSDGAQSAQIKQKFEDKLKDLLSENLPEDRMATEAALLAVKADIREELDRLDAHIDQANVLLLSTGPVGRKLDFLSQEFIREINTMCSKSTDIELTQIGLEMKSLIEQFREQAANVE